MATREVCSWSTYNKCIRQGTYVTTVTIVLVIKGLPPFLKDASGRDTEVEQLFSLDGSIPPLQTLPQLLLLTDARSLVCSYMLCVTAVVYTP